MYDISVSTMCISCDYCVYHYKSTELVSLYTLDIGLSINIIIIIIVMTGWGYVGMFVVLRSWSVEVCYM